MVYPNVFVSVSIYLLSSKYPGVLTSLFFTLFPLVFVPVFVPVFGSDLILPFVFVLRLFDSLNCGVIVSVFISILVFLILFH